MTATAKKPARQPKATRSLDADRLARLAGMIEALKATRLTDVVHRLETGEGATIAPVGDRGTVVKLAGIETSSTAGVSMALTNWANAPRRAVRQAGAA